MEIKLGFMNISDNRRPISLIPDEKYTDMYTFVKVYNNTLGVIYIRNQMKY